MPHARRCTAAVAAALAALRQPAWQTSKSHVHETLGTSGNISRRKVKGKPQPELEILNPEPTRRGDATTPSGPLRIDILEH